MKTSLSPQTDSQETHLSPYETVKQEALINTASALRSINSQYELTPEGERGEVSEINQARKGAELAMVSLAIIASDGDETRTREILSGHGHKDLF